MTIQVVTMSGTTASDGTATADTTRPVTGELLYVEVEGEALTDSANLTIKPVHTTILGAEELGESIINNGDIGNSTFLLLYPRKFVQDNAGADLAVATGQKVAAPYFVPGVKLRATIDSGGATKAFRIKAFVRTS